MRRIWSVILVAVLAVPAHVLAAESEDAPTTAPKKKKKVKKVVEVEVEEDEAAPSSSAESAITQTPEVRRPWPRHRYVMIAGGAVFAGGLAFAYAAQGEAKRAETIGSAREAVRAQDNARAAAATANVMYGLALATLAYATILEFLPESAVRRLSLTFHF